MQTNLNANSQLANENNMELSSASLTGSGATAPNSNGNFNLTSPEVQIWNSAWDAVNNEFVSIENIVELIANSDSNEKIIELRRLHKLYVETGDKAIKAKYSSIKSSLPLITFTSIFDGRRKEENLIEYTGYIILDIDLDQNPDLPIRKELINQNISDCPFTSLMFDSPSADALKICVKTHLNDEIAKCNKELKNCKDAILRKELIQTIKSFHFLAHKSIREYYSNKFDIVIDNAATHLQGECFLSGDSNIYYNPNSSKFNVVWTKPEQIAQTQTVISSFNYSNISHNEILEAILRDFTKNCSGRNTATFTIAIHAKQYNINVDEILQFVMSKFGAEDFTRAEAIRTIRSAFKYTPYNQYIYNLNNSNKTNEYE